MNSIISERCPHVLMVAEESTEWAGVTRPVNENGLGFKLKWNMGWMNDFLSYISKETVHRKYHHNQLTFAMMYAYSEKFILVLSHDEVVHGKCSLIAKMPGDIWQKCANLRVSLGFMMGHPGKKLMFMGGEFAQFSEWYEAVALDWFLVEEYEFHRKMQAFVKDLNNLYLKEKPFWHDDFGAGYGSGFEWINCDDAEHSLISFFRRAPRLVKGKQKYNEDGTEAQEIVVFMCNFTPVPWLAHRVGVPVKGEYTEVLNSDDVKYGGSGIVNGSMQAELIQWDNMPYSVGLAVPPLGISILKLQS
jgi:1,4-alpha-glucan branching enzyme